MEGNSGWVKSVGREGFGPNGEPLWRKRGEIDKSGLGRSMGVCKCHIMEFRGFSFIIKGKLLKVLKDYSELDRIPLKFCLPW